ncbi:MFS transporter [Pseudodesulfovibrio sp. zrk46]|uniref:MFS transporter n=1 Tax=Pseudodesulfovibrio sp. zrk46 TaxID=2725288 RepID=UPI0014493F07|nr:MFS transporter [Pseudodesulfovibrio sp. zrk46]QJB56519.1 MFS transporter [Pseudodesulfovibrio sp. zrk46]
MPDKTRIPQSFKSALPAVSFVTAIFFCNFLSRVVFAPLMPVIQNDLGFTHAGAGHLFLALAIGNGTGLLASGFISRELNHRATVGVSAIMVGICALLTPMAHTYTTLLLALFALGVAVGLYLPSGIAAITSLVRKEDWGKAMAMHEMAPNSAYVMAPLLAEAVLFLFDWRMALYLLGAVQICLGIWFIKAGKGGEFPGMVPGPLMVRQIVHKPVFWMIVALFAMAVGASIGPYSMMPLYLVDAHGYTREEANQLLAASRVMACFVPFAAGWVTDKWGAKPAIFIYLVSNGAALILLGLTSGPMLAWLVVLQPVFSVILFAPGFTILSNVFPPEHRSVAIALMGPVNATFGVGLIPTFLGHMGDAGLFHIGFLIQGCLLLAAMVLLPKLPSGRVDQAA